MNLRALRERAGLSQKEVADAADLDQTSVGKLELGRVPDPRISTIDSLARVYGVSREQIILAIAESVREGVAA